MTGPRGSFRPEEIVGPGPNPSDADLAAAYAAARELEAGLTLDTPPPSDDFVDRVMTAVATEPAPRRTGFLTLLRARPGLAGLLASVREAWAVAAGGAGRPMGARGLAFAYVLAVAIIGASLTGVAAYGAAGALGFLSGDRSPAPSQESPSSAPIPDGSPSMSTRPSAEPSETVEPSASPEPTDFGGPSPSDDTGGPSPSPTPSPSGSDDGGIALPEPSSFAPRPAASPASPSDSPKPSETPH